MATDKGLANLHEHVADEVLNVLGLVADGNLGQAGKVNQREVEHCKERESEGREGEEDMQVRTVDIGATSRPPYPP